MSGNASVVLLIGPNDTSFSAYADALRASGLAVVGVADGRAAAQALATVTPRMIVARFDPRTHDECFALCEQLKADARLQMIPIVLVSEIITSDDLQRATHLKVLGLAAGPHDSVKMTGAVQGVLAAAESD